MPGVSCRRKEDTHGEAHRSFPWNHVLYSESGRMLISLAWSSKHSNAIPKQGRRSTRTFRIDLRNIYVLQKSHEKLRSHIDYAVSPRIRFMN